MIPPYGKAVVSIIYVPSDLNIIQTSDIVFSSDEIGTWRFLAAGIGEEPTPFDLTSISGLKNRKSSGNIDFSNPFEHKIQIMLFIHCERKVDEEVFELLLKKRKIVVQAKESLTIPFVFRPRRVGDFFCDIIVKMNEDVSWRYPIKVTRSSSLLLIIVGSH